MSVVGPRAVAQLIGKSAGWFYAHRAELEALGFPKKDLVLGGWHKPAIEAWLARRAGIVQASPLEEEREKAYAALRGRGLALRHG